MNFKNVIGIILYSIGIFPTLLALLVGGCTYLIWPTSQTIYFFSSIFVGGAVLTLIGIVLSSNKEPKNNERDSHPE